MINYAKLLWIRYMYKKELQQMITLFDDEWEEFYRRVLGKIIDMKLKSIRQKIDKDDYRK